MRSVELFAGGGGLALGTHMAGFSTEVVAEWDRWACDTLRENAAAGHPLVQGVAVHEGDVRDVAWERLSNQPIDLVSGGPPCQPFSAGGKGMAATDPRDMFPATAEVIRQLRPRAFVIENVRGLTRKAFADYFDYIQLRLAHPEIVACNDELWIDHYRRLKSEHESVKSDLSYDVSHTLVNAANYGVPQQRWRVFIVGFRHDVEPGWKFPAATHSREALRWEQDVTGEYWDRHSIKRPESEHSTSAPRTPPELRAWRTVRDAIADLPDPSTREASAHLDHVFQPGARAYPGHTGSFIDAPAKALKAGVHGVPGGENMIRFPDGRVRYFTVREAARLQTFPDDYRLHGPWSEAMRQLGNAVPVKLAHIVASSVRAHLALTSADRHEGASELRATA